jgi:hypothetical protein
MSVAKVIQFGEAPGTMTYAEGLAFIERTRRQLDRFDDAMPRPPGETIAPEDAQRIRTMLGELEADLRKDLGHI